MAGGAEAAVPADGQERRDDVVALLDARDARADLLDDRRRPRGRRRSGSAGRCRRGAGARRSGRGPPPPSGSGPRPALGSSRSSSAISQSRPVSHSIAALVFTRLLLPVTPTARSYRGCRFRCAAPAPLGARRSAAGGGGLREAGVGGLRRPSRSRIAECQSSSAGGSTSWYWRSCLTRGLRRAILNAEAQPRGADASATARGCPRSGSRTRSGRGPALRLSACAARLRLASLSSALVSRESCADRHVVGAAGGDCAARS